MIDNTQTSCNFPPTTADTLSGPSRASFDDIETIKRRQDGADVFAVVVQAAGVVGLLEGFVGLATSHVAIERTQSVTLLWHTNRNEQG